MFHKVDILQNTIFINTVPVISTFIDEEKEWEFSTKTTINMYFRQQKL